MDGNNSDNGSNDSGGIESNYEGGYESNSGNDGGGDEDSSNQDQGSDWNTTFESFYDGTVEHGVVTAYRDSQSDSESDYGFSNFDSISSSGNEGSNSNSNDSKDINIPASLRDNGNFSQTLSLLDMSVMIVETVIGTIEEAHEVAKVNMPKGMEKITNNANKAIGVYNVGSYLYKYGDAIKNGDYRTATSESINTIVGAGVSFIPMGGPLLGVAIYGVMEHYDIGGQIYDGINSLDIGVGLYDLIHDDTP